MLKCQAGLDIECSLAIDITLESRDGVQFGAHSANLALYCDAFPDTGSVAIDSKEVVQMKESSEVVLLLLQFMHRQRQPEMSNLPFEVFAELADAVEKYVVFSAMGVCKKKMENLMVEHPLEVLVYAARYNHRDLRNITAPLTLHMPTKTLASKLGRVAPGVCLSLILLREDYTEAAAQLYSSPPQHIHRCPILTEKLAPLTKKPLSLALFDEAFSASRPTCAQCWSSLIHWQAEISARLKSLPAWVEL